MDELAIKIEHVSKEYRLGAIGGGTLRGDLQTWWARKRGKENPNAKIGARTDIKVGERFLALDDINIEVKKGEALGIIGHNGAGKSTLLKLLSRVTAPTSGTISYNGRIASMLEVGTGFHPELTGRENVYMNGAILGMSKAEIDRKFDQIVEFAEMRRFIDTPVKRYSSGMYVKLAFAVAAHLDSEIMVMDEVLAVGDMKFQQKCLGKMGDAANNDGRTVLYVSHNMSTIRQLCSRCVVLDHGRLIYDGDVNTAISLYMGLIASYKTENRYDDAKYHPLTKATSGLLIKRAVLSGGTQVEKNGWIQLDVMISAKRDYENVGLRFEIQYLDGSIVATAFTENRFDFISGEVKQLTLEVCVKGLAPSNYRVDIIAFQTNEFGTQELIDAVYPGFFIGVNETDENGIQWLHQSWGHVQLADVKRIKEKSWDE